MAFKRIVVKIGTNALMRGDRINKSIIKSLAQELSEARKNGSDVMLVTSGAIGFGIEKMHRGFPPDMQTRQAMAAIGQNLLMSEYEKAFRKHGQVIAQVLLTPNVFTNHGALSNLGSTLEKLFEMKAIPIINENDVVAVEALSETKPFSDNDGLAALMAVNFNADLMILLTDVDGFFTENPKENHKAKKIRSLKQLLAGEMVHGRKSKYGLGGIKSKTLAVQKVVSRGISAAVCKARKGAVKCVLDGNCSGSFFEAGK
ncbi:MAG: glutamate 5-kinase [archaeon]